MIDVILVHLNAIICLKKKHDGPNHRDVSMRKLELTNTRLNPNTKLCS